MNIAFLGFGNVARELARILVARRERLRRDYGVHWRVTGIATGSHGCVVSPAGIEMEDAVHCVEQHGSLADLEETVAVGDTQTWLQQCEADVLFETTPLSPLDGEPASSYIRAALNRPMHIITANKGPLACAYEELRALARAQRRQFRFEGTVLDGIPVFNLREFCLPGVSIRGFAGVLNSTTNYILTGMEKGRSLAECLAMAQELGFAEANPDYDLDGWDTAVKAVALANVLMSANLRPTDVQPQGIRGIRRDELEKAREAGKTIRLLAVATALRSGVEISVAPQLVALDSVFATLDGASSGIIFDTDLAGEFAILAHHPRLTQTAYALLSDFLCIVRESRA